MEHGAVYYKNYVSDLTSPVQGAAPPDGWSGQVPFLLPAVEVDATDEDCGAGWNACRDLAAAAQIGGLWKSGRPNRFFELRAVAGVPVYDRGEKSRSAQFEIVREVPGTEAAAAFSRRYFADVPEMEEQHVLWMEALGRPAHDEAAVERGLQDALTARGLDWKLKRYADARDAWSAWSAWDARAARAAWGAWGAWDAWAVWDARAAWDAWSAWSAWDAWDARDAWAASAAWSAWDARAAWSAWDALTVFYASRKGWVGRDALLLTAGIREAYRNGLEVALPTGPNELGWAI